MEVQLNNLINNTKSKIYINSTDTVIGIKNLISSTFPPENKINALNISLSYLDPNTNCINYMLSPYRTILSYEGVISSKQINVEQIGIQLDSALAIIIENLLPVLSFYYLYKNDFYYTKLYIHTIIFFLTCLYFICRFFICLKCYKNGKYFLNKLIINLILYWFLYSIVCGYSIFSNNIDDMTIYSYLFAIFFIFCDFFCVKLVKEKKDNEIKNVLFNYVKYPYLTLDCLMWISMMVIVYNTRIIFFGIIKILYNIFLAYEEYIEEQGLVKMSSNLDERNNFYYNNNSFHDNKGINKNTKNVIIPFIL